MELTSRSLNLARKTCLFQRRRIKRLTTATLLLSSAVVRAQSARDFAPPVTYESIPVTLINPTMYWGAAGDFNGDGRMDLVSVDSFANNVVGYSNINGFSIALATPTGFAAPISKSNLKYKSA